MSDEPNQTAYMKAYWYNLLKLHNVIKGWDKGSLGTLKGLEVKVLPKTKLPEGVALIITSEKLA